MEPMTTEEQRHTKLLTFEAVGKASVITQLPTHLCTTTGLDTTGVVSLPPGELAPGWRLKRAIPLTVERDDDGSWLVSDSLFLCYGAGDSLAEAMHEYALDLTTYYAIVARNAAGRPATQALLELFAQYVGYEG
jgi:hypothetical protein